MADPWTLIKNGKEVDFTADFSSTLDLLKNFTKKHLQKNALIFDDWEQDITTKISYSEFFDLICQTANFLKSELKNDTFSYAFSNSPQMLVFNLAAMIARKIFVPLETKRDSLEQKIYKLKLTSSKLLFLPAPDQAEGLKKNIPDLKIITLSNIDDLEKLVRDYPVQVTEKVPLEKDCLVLFTSGTTALPKGVRLTQKNLWANADGIAQWLKFESRDRFNIVLPLHHINSITFSLTTLIKGATIILSPRYSKTRFFETLAKHRCTGSSIVPTIAYDLLSEIDSFNKYKKDLLQLTRIQIGSAPVNPTVVEQFIKKYRIPLIQGYGQTETALRSSGLPMDLSRKDYQTAIKLNTVGTELKWTNVTVLKEDGSETKEGQEGEICVRGPIITPGYLNNAQANKQAFTYNWFHSGDLGYFKLLFGKKYFFLTGRVTEIIKKGGVLISPLSIENTLMKNYPKLGQVFVVGFPDPRMGEEIGFISASSQQVVNKILADARINKINNLSPYETPKAGLFVDDEDLPKTSTGKVQRGKIKEIFGATLSKVSRTITASSAYSFREIKTDEIDNLKQAVRINNLAWGKNLQSSLEEFVARAGNGILIGAFDKDDALCGTVSVLQTTKRYIEKCLKWMETTGNGTLKTADHKGDALLCVAISTPPNSSKKPNNFSKVKFSTTAFEEYINSDKDYVIRFHRKPKGGLAEGAKLVKILANSRPEDKDALGYNILMKYPTLEKQPEINPNSSCGTQLIEAALLFGFYHNFKDIYVLTRPAQAKDYFLKT